jgi:hypothetical protein
MAQSQSSVCHFDGHSLKVHLGVARENDFENSVKALIAYLNEKRPGENYGACTYKLVIVQDADGGIYGYGHLWLSDSRIVNILLGLNPDGSECVEWIPDPRHRAPPGPVPEVSDDEEENDDDESSEPADGSVSRHEKSKLNLERESDLELEDPNGDDSQDEDDSESAILRLAVSKSRKESAWDDASSSHVERVKSRNAQKIRDMKKRNQAKIDIVKKRNEKRAHKREEIRMRYTAPMIRGAKKEPLASLPGFEFDDQQLQGTYDMLTIAEKQLAAMEGREPTIIPDEAIPNIGYFQCEAAEVDINLPDKYQEGALGCAEIPSWVTVEMLRPYFSRYSTSDSPDFPKITITPRYNHANGNDKMPFKKVTVQYSTYGTSRYDSEFARRFTRKFSIENTADRAAKEAALLAGKAGADKMVVRSEIVRFDRWQHAGHDGGEGGRGGCRGGRGGHSNSSRGGGGYQGGRDGYRNSNSSRGDYRGGQASAGPRSSAPSSARAPVTAPTDGTIRISSKAQFFGRA